jgi:hypothetical protein
MQRGIPRGVRDNRAASAEQPLEAILTRIETPGICRSCRGGALRGSRAIESPAFAERPLAFSHVFRDRSAATASKIDLVGDAELRRFIENVWPNGFFRTAPYRRTNRSKLLRCARASRASPIRKSGRGRSRPLGSVHKRIAVPQPRLANREVGGCPYRNPSVLASADDRGTLSRNDLPGDVNARRRDGSLAPSGYGKRAAAEQ